jgi:hypothetical protein
VTFYSHLGYGIFGSGKSAFATGSFWDFQKEQYVEGQTGRWLLLGREANQALGVPESDIKRFPMTVDKNPLAFIEAFSKYIKLLAAKAAAARGGKGEAGPMNIVVDGFTEMNHAFTWAYEEEEEPSDKWETYREFKKVFIETIHLLNPNVLDANIFATARVGEFKKAKKDKESKVKADPEYTDNFSYFPAVEGWAKLNMGHYFDFVTYHEQEFKKVTKGLKTTKSGLFVTNWAPEGDFVVKNNYGHKWGAAGLDTRMENATWPQIKAALESL